MKFGIGQAVTRVEDQRLLIGQGRYTDDVAATASKTGTLHAYIVRSPYGHADIAAVDSAAAGQAAGVVAVLTGADVAADELGDMPCMIPITNRDGSQRADTPWPILAQQRVRYVGEPVALIIAEDLLAARDAAELIEIDYRPLAAVTGTKAAANGDAAQLWPHIDNNTVFDWEKGDRDGVERALTRAARCVDVELVNNRIIVNSMEPRPIFADYDTATGRSTLYSSTQGPSFIQGPLAALLGIDAAQLRCVTEDVGGGFGMKVFLYPEHALVTWASRRLKRPVRYLPERSDAFVSDVHGRDNVSLATAALDEQGKIIALKVTTYANMGAYLSNFGPFIPTECGTHMLSGCYDIPSIYVNVKGVVTNTTPVDAYRGAGRPEATYVIERVIDVCARELGLSLPEMRRRNFIRPAQMPYTTTLGNIYDSGDFFAVMDKALAAADWHGFAERKRQAAAQNPPRLRGIGIATYIERCGGGTALPAKLVFNDDSSVTVLTGTQSNGQGHETSFTQILSERLGIDAGRIRVVQGDTDRVPGGFTGGSRSLPVGGAAVMVAADAAIAKGKRLAAHCLEAAEADIEFSDGAFSIAGTDRTMTIFELAAAAKQADRLPPDADLGIDPETGLDSDGAFTPSEATYPNGCHVCELEIDPATGVTEIVRYVIVDDFGATINPLLLTGQVHGGVVQGIGQALFEQGRYDADGQLLTGSFMDYVMPRADKMPAIDFAMHNIPCATNPLGIKGAGEAGAIGAPPATVSAVVDALYDTTGLAHIDMPVTAQTIWALLNRHRQGQAA